MAFYHPLTLGVRRSRPSEPSKALTKEPLADLSYEMWREGLARLDITYEEHPEARVLEAVRRVAEHASRRLWLILGEPGAGKSTLLKAWFERWAGALTERHLGMPVPVLVRLRQLTPGDLDGDGGTVASRLWNYGVPSSALLDRPLEPVYSPGHGPVFRPVWFLDGLDEIDSQLRGEKLYQRLVNLPGVKVVTCRTAVYEALRRDADAYKEQEYEVLGLKPAEQPVFLKSWGLDPDRAEELHRKVQQNAAVRLLAANPLMLTLIAEVSERMTLPPTRAAFYQAAVEEMWSRKLANSEAEDLLEERDRALSELAQRMALDLDKVESRRHELIQITKAVAADKASLLRDALEQAGLLRVNQRRATFSFIHLTFQEFYLARALKPAGLKPTLQNHWHDPRYEETLGLLISILFEDGCLEDIEKSIYWLIAWGEEVHRKDLNVLYQKRNSPLRIALHLLQRAAVQMEKLPKLESFIRKKIGSFPLRRLVLADDKNTPAHFLAELARDPDKVVRWRVAGNPNTPPELLAQLIRDPDERVRWEAAGNPNTPPELLAQLIRDPDEGVRNRTAGNLNTPPELLAELARDPDKVVRWRVADNPNTPPELLAELARDPDEWVRQWAATNPNTPPELLAELARDPDQVVRWRVAMNPSTPPEVLAELARDPDQVVRQWAAANPSIPPEVLAQLQLLRDPDKEVRQRAAGNPNTPPELLAQLIRDPDEGVRSGAAGNPSTPPELLAQLLRDPDKAVRLMAAGNPSTPPEVLAQLLRDPDKAVRLRAVGNPKMFLEDILQ